jgi:hypothetical protein
MSWLDLALVCLFAFYLAYAVSSTHGPFNAFATLRQRLPLGGLTACLICLSFWLSIAGYLLLQTIGAPIVYAIAPAGAAVLLWRYTGGSHMQ